MLRERERERDSRVETIHHSQGREGKLSRPDRICIVPLALNADVMRASVTTDDPKADASTHDH